MPTMVQGEDGREIAEKLGDQDALELAQKVHENTGETVTLTPYKAHGDGYVLDHVNEHVWPREQAPDEYDLDAMTGAQLDELAAKYEVADYKKSAKVADKRNLLAEALSGEGE